MDDRDDLAAMLATLARRLAALERPLLERHELSMWAYVVLLRLGTGAAPTQLALAADIGYDKTRLIGVLDGLETQGLVERAPDPADRRARIVTLTAAGRRRLAAARTDVRAMEEQQLAGLDPAEAERFLATLAQLAGA